MPSEPVWLTVDDLISLNRDVVAATGEDHGILNPGCLESAAARPRNHFEYAGDDDAVRLAVTPLTGIVQNHSFMQGNTRTAARAAVDFMAFNGYEWTLVDDGEYAGWILAFIEGDMSEEELAASMSAHVSPIAVP